MMAHNNYIDTVSFELNDSTLEMELPTSSNVMQISNPSSAASSVPNTDEEDDDGNDKMQSYKERRREAHTMAEKKRRDAIRKGYEDLQMLVPNCSPKSDSVSSQKLSKAVILQRSLSYLEFLQQQQKKQSEELSKLKKQKLVLTIMKNNYEQIVKQQMSSNNMSSGTVPEEMKFRVFQQLMEKLFISFNATVSMNDFHELSHGVINWIEEYCKPQTLRSSVQECLMELNTSQQFF